MNIYWLGLLLGFAGIVAMALLSAGDDDSDASDVGNDGDGESDGEVVASESGDWLNAFKIASWFSPRVLFSVLLGFGAAGVLARKVVGEPWLFVLATACGIAFESFVFRPLWKLMFRFASEPGRTLESLALEEARVVTGFDASGHGLVAIDLDGQVVQMLARLSDQARQSSTRIRVGDVVFVEAIDAAKNSCVVSPLKFSD